MTPVCSPNEAKLQAMLDDGRASSMKGGGRSMMILRE
jgi:hypothetical protein